MMNDAVEEPLNPHVKNDDDDTSASAVVAAAAAAATTDLSGIPEASATEFDSTATSTDGGVVVGGVETTAQSSINPLPATKAAEAALTTTTPTRTIPDDENGSSGVPQNNPKKQHIPVVPSSSSLSSAGLNPNTAAATTTTTTTTTSPSLLDEANEELAHLLTSQRVAPQQITAIQSLLQEHSTLTNKVSKLKNLLGRSAKAQKETKHELDMTRMKLQEAKHTIEHLQQRIDTLASRPTHMDLIADFETNFDRALLSAAVATGVHMGQRQQQQQQQQQSGGEDPAGGSGGDLRDDEIPASSSSLAGETNTNNRNAGSGRGGNAVVDSSISNNNINNSNNSDPTGGEASVSSMLLTELSETRNRVEHLERLNKALLHRASKLEGTVESVRKEREAAQTQAQQCQLELRMTRMELSQCQKELKEKSESLREMQLEIDLITKASMDANARAAVGMEVVKSVKTERKHVTELEKQVQALQEWAVASAEAKSLAMERVRELESKLRELTGDDDEDDGEDVGGFGLPKDGVADGEGGLTGKKKAGSGVSGGLAIVERRLWKKSSSMVIGAGDDGFYVVELGECNLAPNETVLLRWKFDITPSTMDIDFSILKGLCDTPQKQSSADALIKDRHVQGGSAGEIGGAFAIQNSCTLIFSNKKAWVRPKAIKFTVEAYAVMD